MLWAMLCILPMLCPTLVATWCFWTFMITYDMFMICFESCFAFCLFFVLTFVATWHFNFEYSWLYMCIDMYVYPSIYVFDCFSLAEYFTKYSSLTLSSQIRMRSKSKKKSKRTFGDGDEAKFDQDHIYNSIIIIYFKLYTFAFLLFSNR